MGNVESRFRESVESGDHKKAYELYYNKKLLRDSVDPRAKCCVDGSSLLHQTARHAMQPLYEAFLESSHANPLETTNDGKCCIHLICSENFDPHIRLKMLDMTLQYSEQLKQINDIVSLGDKSGNTPLHYACSSGLEECVLTLLRRGANPSLTNKEGLSPVDVAASKGYSEIAKKLETHIVFSTPKDDNEPIIVEMDPQPKVENKPPAGVALKNQEIQSMKDVLIIETSELLGVSLFVAEALLRNNEWSKETLLESWMSDPQKACEKAGVNLPTYLSVDNILDDVFVQDAASSSKKDLEDCPICFADLVTDVQTSCEHRFCVECWRQYLHDKIANGQVGEIKCPAYACYKLVPIHIVEKLVSREMASKYLQYDIKAFVDTNPNIRWCPHPGCGQAVKKPLLEQERSSVTYASGDDEGPTCLFVHCGNDHYFCWLCGEEIGHAPCSCKEWKDWLDKIKELCGKLGNMTSAQVADAASSQWVFANSKPCPSCSAPIEKTEGCNHMKCWKCKHDFCWMCLDRWSKHSSATGGYFECNRYKQIEKVTDMMEEKLQNEDFELISHFKHYYERYSNHLHSLKLESKYLYSADTKMAELQKLAGDNVIGGVQFVKDAVRHLVEARHTVIASYGYGYFIMVRRVKEEFERMQGEFEEQVEALAEVVARPHLRKSKHEIIQLTNSVKDMRLNFITKVEEGIQPRPPTPTFEGLLTSRMLHERLREERKRLYREERLRQEMEKQRQMEEERQIRQAIQESTKHYQVEARLNSDTELAILLSMQDHNDQQSPTSFATSTTTATGYEGRYSPAQYSGSSSSPSIGAVSSHLTYPMGSSTDHQEDYNDENPIDLDRWRRMLLEGPHNFSSSSSPSPISSTSHTPSHTPNHTQHTMTSNRAALKQPVDVEDEELQTAIALSLSVATKDTAAGKQAPAVVYNDLDMIHQPLPPSRPTNNQLLNLLQSTKRQATDV